MRIPVKSLLIAVLAIAAVGAASHEAQAQYQRSFLIKRPGLHSGKLGPGAAKKCQGNLVPATPNKSWDPQLDAITSVILTRSATSGCPGAASVNTVGDSFFVNWSGECVQQGDFVILTFNSTTPLDGGGVLWKDQFNTTVDTGSFTRLTFPALDARGMILLVMGLGSLGLWALRRRSTTPNAI